jgi:hypothetical protein
MVAAAFLLIVGQVSFVATVTWASLSGGPSPWTLIFGPVPGNPLITELYYLVPAVLIQAAVGRALRHNAAASRVIGAVGAFAIAGFCLVWLVMVAYGGLHWLTTGTLVGGDYLDAIGIAAIGVPLALVMLALNAGAGWMGARDLAGHRTAPLAR